MLQVIQCSATALCIWHKTAFNTELFEQEQNVSKKYQNRNNCVSRSRYSIRLQGVMSFPCSAVESSNVSVWCHIIHISICLCNIIYRQHSSTWELTEGRHDEDDHVTAESIELCVEPQPQHWGSDFMNFMTFLLSPSSRHVYWRNIHWVVSRGDPLSAAPGV